MNYSQQVRSLTFSLLFVLSLSITAQNQALDLTGAGNEVNVTYNLNSGGFTVEQWINIPTISTTGFLVNQTNTNLAAPLDIYVQGDGSLNYWFGDGTTTDNQTSAAGVITQGVWHHVAVVYDPADVGNERKVYVDGNITPVISGSVASPFQNIGPIRIGRRDDAVEGDDMLMDEIRIWNIARSAAEISADYNTTIDPSTTGLDVYLKFENNLDDFAAGDNPGTIAAGSIAYADGAPLANNTLNFDGVDDIVNLGALSQFDIGTTFSFETWINLDAYPASLNAMVFNKWQSGIEDKILAITPSGNISFSLFGTTVNATSTSAIPLSQWVHIAVTYDGANAIIYINGEQDISAAATGDAADGAGAMYLGGNGDGRSTAEFEYLDGSLDEVRFWSAARTQSEIHTNAYAAVSPSGSLTAYYDFNSYIASGDNSGVTSLFDVGGNGLDGTLSGPFALLGSSSNWVSSTAWDNDVFAPLFDIGFPSVSDIQETTFDVNSSANEGGLVYGVVLLDGEPAPSSAEVKAGTGQGGSAPQTFFNFGTNATANDVGGDLFKDTEHDVYLVAEDFEPNTQSSPTKLDVRTGGTFAGALFFDGVDDYVAIPDDPSLDISSDLTVETWVRFNGVITEETVLVSKWNPDDTPEDRSFLLQVNSSSDVGFIVSTDGTTGAEGTNFSAIQSNFSFTAGRWYHIAGTYEPGVSMKIYVNGELIGENTASIVSSIYESSASVVLGANGNFVEVGAGSVSTGVPMYLDETRIWSTVRSEDDIRNGLLISETGSVTDLIASYTYETTSGTTLFDQGSIGNDGVLNDNNNGVADGITAGPTWENSTAFDSDVIAPFDVAGYPFIDNITDDGFEITGQLTEEGTISYVVLTDGATAPGTDDIRAGTGFAGALPEASGTINVSIPYMEFMEIVGGLSSSTDYDVYMVAEDLAGDPNVQINTNIFDVTTNSIPVQHALNFDGASDFVSFTRQTLSSGLTYEAWINTTSTANTSTYDGNPAITVIGDNNTGIEGAFGIHDGKVRYTHWQGTATDFDQIDGTVNVNDGNWHHIAVTHDDGTNEVRLYVDGILDVVDYSLIYSSGMSANRVGSSYLDGTGNDNFFLGEIDEVRIWDVVLTENEIRDHIYNQDFSANINYTSLLVHYGFDQGVDAADNTGLTTLNDLSSNALDGTLNTFTLNGATSNWVSSGIFSHTPTTPATQASNLIPFGVTASSADLTWTNGDGQRRIVVVHEGTGNAFPSPSDNVYGHPDEYGLGDDIDNGWYVVYNGYNNAATISGLSPETDYEVAVLEVNGPVSFEAYNATTATNNPETFTTSAAFDPRAIYFTEASATDVYTLPLSGGIENSLASSNSGFGDYGIDYHPGFDLIYYVDGASTGDKIMTATPDGITVTEFADLGSSGTSYRGLAVDTVNNFLYVAAPTGMLEFDMTDGSLLNTYDVFGLTAYDVEIYDNHIYWSESGGGGALYRASLGDISGSITQIMSSAASPGNFVQGIAIEPNEQKIYWTNDNGEIRKADLDGANDEIVISGLSTSLEDIEIDYESNRLIYVDNPSNSTIVAADYDGTFIENLLVFSGSINYMHVFTNQFDGGGGSDFALDFDGVASNLTVDDFTELGIANGTIEAWINPSTLALDGSSVRRVLAKPSGTTNDTSPFQLAVTDGGAIRLTLGNGGASISFDSNTGLVQTGMWQHISVTWDGSNVRFYYNGVEDLVVPQGGFVINTNTNPLIIGGFNGLSSFGQFEGGIDEVRIWDIARSESEIDENRYFFLSGGEPGLVLYLPMIDGTGSLVATDLVAGNDATLVNMDENTDWIAGPGISVGVPNFSFYEDFDDEDLPTVSTSGQLLLESGSWDSENVLESGDIDALGGTGNAIRVEPAGGNYIQTPYLENVNEFVFWYKGDGSGGTFEVQTSSDGGTTFDISHAPDINPTVTYQEYNLSLSSYNGPVRIAYISGTSPIFIDNVGSDGDVIPVDVTYANVTAPGVSLTAGSNDNLIYAFSITPSDVVETIGVILTLDDSNYDPTDFPSDPFKLWINTDENFGTATQIGNYDFAGVIPDGPSVAANQVALLFTEILAAATPTYFYVTVDIASGATTSNSFFVQSIDLENEVGIEQTNTPLGSLNAGEVFIIGSGDVTPPEILSITADDTPDLNSDFLSFTITFSEEVTGIDAGDFVVTTVAGDAVASIVTPTVSAGTEVGVVVENIFGQGQIRLDFDADASGGVEDGATNVSVTDFNSGETYTIDTYCDPIDGSVINAIIESVQLNTLTNSSADDFTSEYTFYTGIDIPSLITNTSETLSVDLEEIPGASLLDVFIDWNADGDFEDAGEQIVSAFAFAEEQPSNDLPFNVPLDAAITETRMRLITYQSPNTPTNGCSGGANSEIEDYIVKVERPSFDAPTISSLTAGVDPVKEFDVEFESLPAAVQYFMDVATDASFTNILPDYDDKSISGLGTIIESVLDLDFAQSYFVRLRADYGLGDVSANSATESIKTDVDPETLADSLALVQIYDAINPQGLNWESARLRNWDGVELDTDRTRVEKVDISASSASGVMPNPFTGDAFTNGGLSNMVEMDVSSNDISGLMDFTTTSISDLNVSANSLTFGDLEPLLLLGLTTFEYADQNSILFLEDNGGEPILIPHLDDPDLEVITDGSDNVYTWYRNDELITDLVEFGIFGPTLVINDIDYENMGVFRAEVSSNVVTGLIIDVDPQIVYATADVTMRLTNSSDALLDGEFDGALLETIRRAAGYDTLNRANGVSSSFIFEDVILGDYLCGIESTNPEAFIPTYFGDAFQWENADVIELRADSELDIVMTEVPDELGPDDGEGTLDLLIEEDFDGASGRIDARRRAARRKCGLRRKRSGGRTGQDDDEFELIAYGETDDNGEFQFGFLPQGTYRFFVEYPGIPLTDDAAVEFEVGEAGISDTDFRLEAFASEDGIEITIEAVLGIILDYFKDLEIYPNPSSEYLNISYRHLKSHDVTAQLVDLSGNTVWSTDLRNGYNGEIKIDVSNYEQGMYILRFYDREKPGENVVSFRVIVKE